MDSSSSVNDKNKAGAYPTWPEEPLRFFETSVDGLLKWCVEEGASDITIQTDRPVIVELSGGLEAATRRALDAADMAIFLHRLYGADALAKLASGTDLDLSYEIKESRSRRIRFRVNITAILSKGRDAVQITMRTLPENPPTLSDLNIEKQIVDNWNPRQGLVLITGPTGSGKSTLLSAGCRMLIEGGCGKLLTYEAPIEYVYDGVESHGSLVSQTEIPRHLPTFASGLRNALRRKPEVILVGESRDRETVSAAIEAAQTGHTVYSTAHTIGVAATIRRMMSVFDPAERVERGYALIETIRMIVTQALVPKVGGGRCGIREWMIFDDDARELLLDMDSDRWTSEIEKMIPAMGQTMAESARQAFLRGDIDRRHYLSLAQGG